MSPTIEVSWPRGAVDHTWERHGVTLEEMQILLEDRKTIVTRSRGNRYRVLGMSRDRMLAMIVERMPGGRYELRTCWPATAKEKRLYRRG